MPKLSTSGKISLVSNVVALSAAALGWWGWPAQPPLPYTLHKMLHILGVIIFMGNLIAGPVWVILAWSARDRAQLAFAARSLATADIALTTPGVQLAVWNGICLAGTWGGIQKQPWLVEAVALLLATSLVSCTVVLYWQERFVERAQTDDDAGTQRALIHWGVWGTLVSVPFALIGWLMVSKAAMLLGP
jgi:uncharacterized membrane protein